jgi:hypothetical protein
MAGSGVLSTGCLFLALWGLMAETPRAAARGREAETTTPTLLIAADRITGFAPFTVTVFGQIRGVVPGSIELCSSRIMPMFATGADRGATGSAEPEMQPERAAAGACVSGRAVPSADGFAYERDLRFDQPGLYHLRLTMLDTSGKRLSSNTVRVSAF